MTRLMATDYMRAEKMLAHNRSALVPGARLRPSWSDDRQSFVYFIDTPSGRRFVLVDLQFRTRKYAFDHNLLAASLSKEVGAEFSPGALPLTGIYLMDGVLEFDAVGERWRLDQPTNTCSRVADRSAAGFGEVTSPDGCWIAFRREHNVWVRSSDGTTEFALTEDGVANFDYGSNIDAAMSRVLLRNLGLAAPAMLSWSPDSTRLLTHQIDQREVTERFLVESTPKAGGAPVLHSYRYAMPEDQSHASCQFVVLDVNRRTVTRQQTAPWHLGFLSPIALKRAWWSEDGKAVHYLQQPRDSCSLALFTMNPNDGSVEEMLLEEGTSRVEPAQAIADEPMVRILKTGEVLWYSQRDGHGHIYFYSSSGQLLRQLTRGPWSVRKLLDVDETTRVLYFVASGQVAHDPYLRQICSVDLDTAEVTQLTSDDYDHDVIAAGDGVHFVDNYSSVNSAPVTVVRDSAGKSVLKLEVASTVELVEAGWTPPERFSTKAADGKTDIYGILWKPYNFDPRERYPIIDSPYPGPQMQRAPASFNNRFTGGPEALAALGFVVVALDGRGTPGRSKAFHDASYGNLGNAGFLEDHVAAISQLGDRYKWIDTDRVGVYGLSGGGFATARAMLAYPDFYKVGVSMSGDHDIRQYVSMWADTYLGEFTEEKWTDVSNANLASNLRGKLLLIHGELDDNVLPYETLSLVDALIEADRDFDLLVVPGVEHFYLGRDHYVTKRTWDYFVRHLMKVEPPENFALPRFPVNLELLAELFS